MKHWILGLVFMALAIYSGFEFGTQIASPEKNWLKIGFFVSHLCRSHHFLF